MASYEDGDSLAGEKYVQRAELSRPRIPDRRRTAAGSGGWFNAANSAGRVEQGFCRLPCFMGLRDARNRHRQPGGLNTAFRNRRVRGFQIQGQTGLAIDSQAFSGEIDEKIPMDRRQRLIQRLPHIRAGCWRAEHRSEPRRQSDGRNTPRHAGRTCGFRSLRDQWD
jgi:hypothetical protein